MLLTEAFVVSKGKDPAGNLIAYIDPNKPENKETFKYKDIFKTHGAKWGGKYWYWYIGKTKDQWQNVYSKLIEPALKDVHKLEGAPEEESQASLVSSLDAIISDLSGAPTAAPGEEGISPEQKKEVVDRLGRFKDMLINLDNDEEFKRTMKTIAAFKNSQGHQYSLWNSILIWLQNPNATFVMSKIRWSRYNRNVKPDAKPIIIRSPSKTALRPYSKQQKDDITQKYIQSLGKSSYGELNIGERDKLGIALRGAFGGHSFDFTPAFDVADTVQIEGKEDYLKDVEQYKQIKWFEDNMISDAVRPIYSALNEFAKENGITVNLVDALKGGSRGVSKSGTIDILKSEGNDVGVTKTLAHEITHELLHQNYLKNKNSKYAQYFVGTGAGRDLVEQQAELSAWIVMASYGFDLKTSSLNYVAIWGADKDAMIRVFDTVTGVVNALLDYINNHINKSAPAPTTEPAAVTEASGKRIAPAKHITPMDVAGFLGVKNDYQQVLNKAKTELVESFNRFLKK